MCIGIFLGAEHVLLFLKVAVETAIPDLPYDVDIAEDKNPVGCDAMGRVG